LICDRWPGIEQFLEPDREVLVASNGDEVAEHLRRLTPARAREMGEAARRRVLAQHTYDDRATQLEAVFQDRIANTPVA
jgi:spore maturation protein CgeB